MEYKFSEDWFACHLPSGEWDRCHELYLHKHINDTEAM
jgi:hypothetical protein